jgi:hypothetical protein
MNPLTPVGRPGSGPCRCMAAASLAVALVATPAAAQSPTPHPKNRLGLSARFGFNIQAEFRNLPGTTAVTDPGPAAGSAIDRYYDDGYVGVDNTGNNLGLTAYWGYQRDSQVTATDLDFHSAPPLPDAAGTAQNDPQTGFEFTYSRELGRSRRVAWGLEAAVGYLPVSLKDETASAGTLTLLTDRYAQTLGAPPLAVAPAPHYGQRNDLGPLIASTPVRSTTLVGAQQSGWRKLEADLIGLRLGPFLAVPLSRRFSLQGSAGVAPMFVSSEFSFSETTVTASGGARQRSLSGTDSGFILGGYAAVQGMVNLGRRWELSVGAQYQYAGSFTQTLAGKEAVLKLQNLVLTCVGFGYSF